VPLFVTPGGITAPGLQQRGAGGGKRIDTPFREDAAGQSYALFALDAKIVVYGVHGLVPEQFAVHRRHKQRILDLRRRLAGVESAAAGTSKGQEQAQKTSQEPGFRSQECVP